MYELFLNVGWVLGIFFA